MNVHFPLVNQFVNQAAHSASESIGTLGSRFVSLFQNRTACDVSLVVANIFFIIISVAAGAWARDLFKICFRKSFLNERGAMPKNSYYHKLKNITAFVVGVLAFVALNSAFTRVLKMPLSRISTITLAVTSAVATLGAICIYNKITE